MSISDSAVSRGYAPRSEALQGRRTEAQMSISIASSRPHFTSGVRFSLADRLACAVIVVCIVTASFPIAEFAFRLLGDEPSADLRGLYTQFGSGNYKLAPNVRTSARFASGNLSVFTDSFGLRCDGAGRFAADPGKPIDMMVVGDSQGFGNGVNFEDSIAGSMAVLAMEQGYRVANASVGGHTLSGQLQVAKWLVEQQKLRINNFIVLLTPTMIHSPAESNQAIVGDDGRLYGDTSTMARLRLWAKSNLVIYSRLRDAVRNVGVGVDPTEGATTVFSFYDTSADQSGAEDRLFDTLESFQLFARRHGAVVHVVYIPLTVEATFESVREAAAKQNISLDPDVSFRIAAAAAARLGIPLHDMRAVLHQAKSSGQVLVVKGDFHYSPILSRAVGAKLWNELSLALRTSRMQARRHYLDDGGYIPDPGQ
jgi:hypothetical protein